MTDKPRLIEVAFPLKQASLTSVHEKNVRHGHISTLHIWPARRPLAACRAALLCTLLPDPGDAQKRQELLDLIGGTVVNKLVTSEDDDGNTVSEEKEIVEGGVLAWGNENAPAMDDLRAAIKKFYGGNAPKVLDPFAGGGAIPLEAMRMGCEVTSADLNPVAWFIQKTYATEPTTNVPKYWRLGPKPNLNQVHHSYKIKALSFAKGKFDELAKKCGPLKEGCDQEAIKFHNQPSNPADVDDDGVFRLIVLGADYAGQPGAKPHTGAESFLRTHSSPTDNRTYQNVVLVVTPSVGGLQQAEQQIADWLAWQEIKGSKDFKDYESHVKEAVNKRERESKQAAETAVKNAFELVLHADKAGALQVKRFTMGAQALFPTLLQEKELRLFKEKIDAETIMPGGPYAVWPATDDRVQVSALYQQFARRPNLPKLLNPQTVTNTIADAVQRGVLALRYTRPDGSEQWFWRCKIDVADWEKNGEAWLPSKSMLNSLSARAVLPESLPGLWPAEPAGVELMTLCSWFDGKHAFQEVTQPGYPPEARAIPQVAVAEVHKAVAQAVKAGDLWLVFGNDSVWQEEPTPLQLDATAKVSRRPPALNAIELLPGALKDAWSSEVEPKTTVATLYAELKKAKGNPWPPNAFISTLSEAVGRGLVQRASGSGPLVSLAADANVKLKVKSSVPLPQPQPEAVPGRKLSPRMTLSAGEVQTLAENVATLTKSLAGCDVQFEVAVSIKAKPETKLEETNKLLEKIKSGWRFS